MDAVYQALEQALRAGVATAAQVAVIGPDGAGWDHAAGTLWPDGPAVERDTAFDLASVTKLTTTLLVGRAVAAGLGGLDDDLSDLHHGDGAPITVRELLGHRSGLPAWAPWFDVTVPDAACPVSAVVSGLASDTTRTRRYSDAGFILLGRWLEEVAGPLKQQLRAFLDPLPVAYHPEGVEHPLAPVTGVWRPREPAPGQEGTYAVPPQLPALEPGLVDDDNAYAMGGVAGHAGAFGPAWAMATLGWWILEDLDGAGNLLPKALMAELVAPDAPHLLPVRSLGFDRRSPGASTLGRVLGTGPKGAIGHLGYTGTSLWIDLDHRVVVALHTNRTYPTRANTSGIRDLRNALHDAVAHELGLP